MGFPGLQKAGGETYLGQLDLQLRIALPEPMMPEDSGGFFNAEALGLRVTATKHILQGFHDVFKHSPYRDHSWLLVLLLKTHKGARAHQVQEVSRKGHAGS